MQTTGVNRVCRRLAATTGLLLILVATAAGADPLAAEPLVTDTATVAASQPLHTDVPATEIDSSVSALVDASKESASTGDKPAAQGDDTEAFLGQLVTQYLDGFN